MPMEIFSFQRDLKKLIGGFLKIEEPNPPSVLNVLSLKFFANLFAHPSGTKKVFEKEQMCLLLDSIPSVFSLKKPQSASLKAVAAVLTFNISLFIFENVNKKLHNNNVDELDDEILVFVSGVVNLLNSKIEDDKLAYPLLASLAKFVFLNDHVVSVVQMLEFNHTFYVGSKNTQISQLANDLGKLLALN
eukprot:TRINITY_DN8676_c0_g1_i1.p1 TRINITY_DN8676_c0_g1~~TRINITY_DN8676_c0_g1_i1.p1  ORF type:complete len:189 (+),score=64.90 TRINITY_DN8676_c0_g1_i1:209-775(+)